MEYDYNADVSTENSEIEESGNTKAFPTRVAETEISESDEDEDNLYVRFKKQYRFEDELYDGIDLSGLDDLNANDLTEIEKKFYKKSILSFTPESTATYAMITAQKVTGFPIEFFEQLPGREMLKIKRKVTNFLFD